MHPAHCPPFVYEHHPQRVQILRKHNAELISQISTGRFDPKTDATDTRPAHLLLFSELCPPGYEYYAGNYRGSGKPCLKHYNIMVGHDPRVGYNASEVAGAMAELAMSIHEGLEELDGLFESPDEEDLSLDEKRLMAIAFACEVFVDFLTIHPYANGNGHTARLCLIAILFRYGILLRGWRIEPRPADPPYSDMIRDYRDGDHAQFEDYVVQNSVTFDPPRLAVS